MAIYSCAERLKKLSELCLVKGCGGREPKKLKRQTAKVSSVDSEDKEAKTWMPEGRV